MIDVKVNGRKGLCEAHVEGHRLDLLAELPILFGKLLFVVLGDCPTGLKNELIKYTFELALEDLKGYGEVENDAN